MNPKILYNGIRPLYVLTDDDYHSEFEREMEKLKANKQTIKKVGALEVMMERFSEGQKLTSAMFHEAGEYGNYKVMEFIKQPIRIYCIIIPNGKGALLISHSILKKWQKTKPSDIEKTISALKNFESLGLIPCNTN